VGDCPLMPVTQVKSPTGDIISVQHPDGASDQEIIDYAKQNAAPVSPGSDVMQSIAAAPRKVAEGLAGLPGTMQQGVGAAFDWMTGQPIGTSEKQRADIYSKSALPDLSPPNPQEIQAQTSKVFGPSYQPQTTPGKYAGAITEGVTGAMLGPGSVMSKLLIGGGAGTGGEIGKENMPNHPVLAGLFGNILGGGLAIGAGKATEALRNAISAKSAGANIGGVLGTGNVPAGAVRISTGVVAGKNGAGLGNELNMGQHASDMLSNIFSNEAGGMGNLAYGQQQGQNQDWSNIFGGGAGMLAGFLSM